MLVTRTLAVTLMLALPALWSRLDTRPAPKSVAPSHDVRALAARERHRLRAHFDSVDGELRTNVRVTLRPSQRAARAQLINWLREYRDAGVFPENDRFAGRMVPFFVDHRGVRCAMGELMYRSGRTDIVDAVASTRNNAYIAELADDPQLVAWLDSVGLTAAEAARIQPAYDGGDGNIIDDVVVAPASATYKGLASGLSAASLAAVVLNARRPSGLSTWAGLALGTAGVISGSLRRQDDISGEGAFTTASITFGAASFIAGAYRVFNPRVAPTGTNPTASRISHVNVSPALLSIGSGRRQAGVSMSATFR